MMYDFVQYQEGGVNWVKRIYYGRQSHALSNRLTSSQEDLEEHCSPGNKTQPTQKQRRLRMNETGSGKGHKKQHNAAYVDRISLCVQAT